MPSSTRRLLIHCVCVVVCPRQLCGDCGGVILGEATDRPYEADEFTSDGGRDLRGGLSMKRQPREFAMQPLLGLPGDLGDARRKSGESLLEPDVEPGTMARVPGGLAEDVAEMGVSGAGDAALGLPTAARVLGRDEPGVAHELGGFAEAAEGADLGDDGDGGQLGHAPQRLQRLDDCLLLGGSRFNGAIDGEVEPGQALTLMQDLGDTVGEGDLLGFEVEFDGLDPSPPGVGPGAAAVWVAEAISQQVLDQAMLGATFVALARRACAHQIAKGLVGCIGHPDGGEGAALVAPGQLLGVAAVGLDLVAGLARDERWGHDLARDTHFRQQPIECVAGRPGLVANLEALGASELLDELPDGLWPVGELTETPDLSLPLADGRSDRFAMNIQPDVSCILHHDRLLLLWLCGGFFADSNVTHAQGVSRSFHSDWTHMATRGLLKTDSIAPESDQDACAFVDSLCGVRDWKSALTSYRLQAEFQADWKAEVGHWLLFAQRSGFLPEVEHLLFTRAVPYVAPALPNGKPDPNDKGHAILVQILAEVEVAYYLRQTGWSFVEWQPKLRGSDIDVRMKTPSGHLVDLQVKASDRPGHVHGHQRSDGEIDEHVQKGMEKALGQIAFAPGPARMIVATPQRTWPMSRAANPIASQMIGSTIGFGGGRVILNERSRGLFASELGKKISAAMILDLIRGLEDKHYGCTIFLNPWAESQVLGEADFPAAAVCELSGERFGWRGSPGQCYVVPSGTRYVTDSNGV